MSYQKTNWQNLPNTTTPVNQTNLNKIETELKYLDDKSLIHKGNLANNTDLNNVTETGIYYVGDATLINAPEDYQYRTLQVINNNNYTIVQFIFAIEKIYIRRYAGSPASWGAWAEYYTSTRTAGSLTSDVGHFEGDSYKWCRRSGNVVTFYFSLIIDTALTSPWNETLVTFPKGFRPKSYTLITMAVGNQSSTTNNYTNVLGGIDTTGKLGGQWKLAVGDKIQLGGTFII